MNTANISQWAANRIFDFLHGINSIPAKLIAGLGITAPLFTLFYSSLAYTVSRYNPKKLAKDILSLRILAHPYRVVKDEMLPNYRERMKSFYRRGSFAVAANWVLVPREYQLIGGGIANYVYRLAISLFGKKSFGEANAKGAAYSTSPA